MGILMYVCVCVGNGLIRGSVTFFCARFWRWALVEKADLATVVGGVGVVEWFWGGEVLWRVVGVRYLQVVRGRKMGRMAERFIACGGVGLRGDSELVRFRWCWWCGFRCLRFRDCQVEVAKLGYCARDLTSSLVWFSVTTMINKSSGEKYFSIL